MHENRVTQEDANKAKELLKASKKQKKAENMKKIKKVMKAITSIVSACVLQLKNMIVVVLRGINDFRKAVNIRLALKVKNDDPKKTVKSFKRVATVGMLSAFLLGLNIDSISIKKISSDEAKIENQIEDAKSKGQSVVSADEISNQSPDSVSSKAKTKAKDESVVKNEASNGDKTNTGEAKAKSVDAPQDNESNEEIEYIIGQISSKFELAKDAGLGSVIKNERTGVVKYGQFTSEEGNWDYVLNFFRYVKENNPEMYDLYFKGSEGIKSEDMTNRWNKVVTEKGNEFNKMQVQYKWDSLINPVVEKSLKELKVDFNGTLLLQELIYSTVTQYGPETGYKILQNANITEGMGEIDILNAVQDEKEKSIGNYTYTEVSDDIKNAIKNRTNEERTELTRIAGKYSMKMN